MFKGVELHLDADDSVEPVDEGMNGQSPVVQGIAESAAEDPVVLLCELFLERRNDPASYQLVDDCGVDEMLQSNKEVLGSVHGCIRETPRYHRVFLPDAKSAVPEQPINRQSRVISPF